MSRVKKIATLTFGQGINVLVNFLFMPYMARVLSYEDYGSYGQVLLIITFLGAILSFGLSQILYVYLNSDKALKTIFSTNIFAAIFMGAIGTIILLGSTSFFESFLNNESLGKLLMIYAFSLIFTLPNQSINSLLIFSNKVKTSAALVVFTNLLKVLLVVFFIQVYHSVYLAFIGILISQVIQFLIGIILTRKSIELKIDKSLFIEQLKKGFPLGLTGILGAGILYVDGLMVSRFEGVQEYAIYRNGAIEVPFISTIYASIAAIIMPEVTKLFSENKLKEIVELKRKVIINTMMLTYPILIFLLFNSKDLIVLYVGEKYEASAIIFAIFNLTLLIRVNDYHDVLVAANKSKIILLYYFIVFLLNIVLNIILIHFFSSLGAAISTIFSLFIFAFLHLDKSLKLINTTFFTLIPIMVFLKIIIPSILLALTLSFIIPIFFANQLKLFIFCLIYFPSIYFYLIKSKLMSVDTIYQILPFNFIKKF